MRYTTAMTKTQTPQSKTDSSLSVELNGVKLPSGEVVAWAVAFPRPEQNR